MTEIAETLKIQSWSLYGVGVTLIGLRMFARVHRLGIKALQIDDYLMLLVGAWYTILITTLNVIAQGGGSNLYEPHLFKDFSPNEIQERIYGSKIVVISEQAMLNGIYNIKVCLLIMYWRLTMHHRQQRLVIGVAIYVAVGWVATQVTFFTACQPFYGYWAMPPTTDQCTTLQKYAIVQACFNLSSDVAMLIVPLPLVVGLKVHWKQKAVLCIVFSLGTFVIIAAVLTKVYNLSNVWDTRYMLWYTREISVAVYVSNLPMIWPLMREYIPFLRILTPIGASNSKKYSKRAYGENISSGGYATNTIGGSRFKSTPQDGITTTIRGKDEESVMESNEMINIHRQGSEDHLRPGSDSKSTKESSLDDIKFDSMAKVGIHVDTTVHVTTEHIQGPPPAFDGGYGPYRSRGTRDRDGDEQQAGFEWQFEKARR